MSCKVPRGSHKAGLGYPSSRRTGRCRLKGLRTIRTLSAERTHRDVSPRRDLPERAPLQLTVVVPTYNERENVLLLLDRLEAGLAGLEWEVLYVDDHSPDGTADLLRAVALTNPRVRVLERIGRRGLSSACIEGMMASHAPYLAIMDADLQHDEAVLPAMFRRIESDALDVVVASRRVEGGSMGEFASGRVRLSNVGTRVSKLVCQTDVSDAMSGFFIVNARFFRSVVPRLTGSGFKLLVDLLASSPAPATVGEVPYTFRTRQLGTSKLDINVQLEYLYLIVDKVIGKWVPTRFLLFTMVGTLGVAVHLMVLAALYLSHRTGFAAAQAIATAVPMTTNFLLNNAITFRDRKLRGLDLLFGLFKFYAACSFGALINMSFAMTLVDKGVPWYVAGASGTVISSVWNYGVNTVLTWRRTR